MNYHIQTINRMWIEIHDDDTEARDVIVQMEDSSIHTALFVTLAYLRRQMELTFELANAVPETVPVRYAALDIPHLLVENLERETIEDTIDNLLELDIFENLFIQVTEDGTTDTQTAPTTTTATGTRATQEVAAVVLSEVLVVEE